MKIQESFLKLLKDNPIIPCTDNFDDMLVSSFDKIKVVLLHENTILNIQDLIKKNKEAKNL